MGSRLEGKVAVVTGGGRGIGRAVARQLAEEGASVVVNDLGCEADGSGSSHGPADKVVAEVTSGGGRAVATYEDVSRFDGGARVIQTAVNTYGRLDVLVNSAAVLADRDFEEMTPEDFDRVIRNNVKGTFVPIRHAAGLFRRQRGGRIVNMTSDAGLGSAGRANYAAASEAIIGLTRTVARDLGKYGVTCNAISPTAATRLFPRPLDRVEGNRGPGHTPAGGAGVARPAAADRWEGPGGPDDPENVAPLAVLLCTFAVPNVNGNVFGVRGGSIFLYSNPSVERSVHKWGTFTLDELDEVVPANIGSGSMA